MLNVGSKDGPRRVSAHGHSSSCSCRRSTQDAASLKICPITEKPPDVRGDVLDSPSPDHATITSHDITSRERHMADPTLLILTSLAEGDKHGYAMMDDIATFAGVRLGPGTLYGAITRLVECGWITPVDSTDRRRPYRL